MYTLTDKTQFQAHAIKRGKHNLAVVHLELMNWITKQFSVHALDFSCERRETSKGIKQQLIHLILETAGDVKKIQGDRTINTMIAERFLQYFKSADSYHAISDTMKQEVFSAETNPFPEIIITYRPLKELSREVLEEMPLVKKNMFNRELLSPTCRQKLVW